MGECIICGTQTVKSRKTCSEEHKRELIRQNAIKQFKDPEKVKRHKEATKRGMESVDLVARIRENRRSYKGKGHPTYNKERTLQWRKNISEGRKGKLKGLSWDEVLGKDRADERRKQNADAMCVTNARLLNDRTSKVECDVFKMLEPYGFHGNVKVGRYVVDMLNESQKLIIEVNGNYWHGHPAFYEDDYFIAPLQMTAKEKRQLDALRVKELKALGYRVVTFWESDIKQDSNVVLAEDAVKAAIEDWRKKKGERDARRAGATP